MTTIHDLLENNRAWAEERLAKDSEYFARLSRGQSPGFIWIGCSDSRVPAITIMDLQPGTIFVHRNIANLVVHTDLNCLSVVQYAVEVLKIKHIIVCGHYGCGGIKAAMESREHGLIDNWLQNIKDIYRYHQAKIDAIKNQKEKWDKMCELNVIEQVANLCHTTIVQNAWKSGQKLAVHGWIYSMEDGILKDMNITTTKADEILLAHKLNTI